MTYRNVALLIVALVLSFAAAGVWIVYTNQQKAAVDTEDTTQTTTTTTPVAPPVATVPTQSTDTALSFTADEMMVGVNQEGEAIVKLDSSGTEVTTVSLVLKFDPSMIRVDSITGAGKFDLYLGNTVDATAGIAKISGATTGGKSVTEDASFAKVKFTRISGGQTALTVATPDSANATNPYSAVIDSTETQYTVPVKTLIIN